MSFPLGTPFDRRLRGAPQSAFVLVEHRGSSSDMPSRRPSTEDVLLVLGYKAFRDRMLAEIEDNVAVDVTETYAREH